jgi:hypothetical protein
MTRMERPEMPVLRYFTYVGAALLALLFIVAEAFPVLPTAQGVTDTAAADVPMIRIHSDRKWPERVVFDTNAPTIVPATVVAAVQAPTPAPAGVADAGTKVTARDAFAQLTPSELKKMNPKPQPKRKIAKRHVAPPPIQVAQRPQFGLFAINLW